MRKVTAPLVITLAWFGCAGPVPPKQVEEPTLEEETAVPEEDTPAATEDPVVETPAEDANPANDEATDATAPPAATAKEEAPSSTPTCAELPKGTCEVTKGCAWNSLSKCVDE